MRLMQTAHSGRKTEMAILGQSCRDARLSALANPTVVRSSRDILAQVHSIAGKFLRAVAPAARHSCLVALAARFDAP